MTEVVITGIILIVFVVGAYYRDKRRRIEEIRELNRRETERPSVKPDLSDREDFNDPLIPTDEDQK